MGEVYRAHDTKLGRDVALKFLRTEFTGDADRLHRFQREARVLASLNHPHIGQIYGLEESEGHSCLVLELVEGESLDERLKRGPIPIDEALVISRQIAEAIEAAHASGILHRDLKPANIKRAASGAVKVLDFGLGKVLETQPELSESPTRLTQVTQPHVLLGTLAYMSPEQVRGGTADERSDVWAFGCVLYELLTARRAFAGSSAADTIGAITKTDPDWSLLPSSTSPNIRRLLRRCLQKDPTSRLQHIGDARIEIDDELAGPREVNQPTAPRRRVSLPWVGVGAAVGAAAVWMLLQLSSTPSTLPKMRLEVSVPGQVNRTNAWLAISPNARQIVFEQNYQRQNMFWIRSMESTELRPLPGTERGMFPFWSPDNRSIAFFSDGKLRRVEVAGGPPQVIADAQNPRGGAWNSEGTILFNAASSGPLSRVSVDGSGLAAATELEKDQGSHRYPQFLPDGRHFLYYALGKPEVSGVYVASLDGKESKRILANSDSQAVYAQPGYLLFLRQGVLLAQPFDPKKLELMGEPLPQAERVATGYTGWMFVSVADDGTIAYGTDGGRDRQITWVDRSGKETGNVGPVGAWATVDLSRDETRVATAKEENGNSDLWMIDVTRGLATRLTSELGDDEDPRWSPNGERIVFDTNRNGSFDIYEITVSTLAQRALFESPETKTQHTFTSDGRYLLFGATTEKTGADLWALPLLGEGRPMPVVVRDYTQLFGFFSPDDKWVVYESNESGRSEIYIQPFPGPGEKHQVSFDGGGDPRWAGNGKEVFYIAPDGYLMAAAVSAVAGGKQIQSEKPVALFQTTLSRPHGYAATRDGQRFLLPIPVNRTSPPITILMNWAVR
jgi:serine/threonine protein kinase